MVTFYFLFLIIAVILYTEYYSEAEDTDSQGNPLQRGPMQTDVFGLT